MGPIRLAVVRVAGWLGLLAALVVVAGPAGAHFATNALNRVVLVERHDDRIRIYMRIPTTLAFSREIAGRASADDPVIAPFLDTVAGSIGYVYYLDDTAVRADPETFGLMVASGYRFSVGGESVFPDLLGVSVHRDGAGPPFTTPDEARSALAADGEGAGGERLFVRDTAVDIGLDFQGVDGAAPIEIASALPPIPLTGSFTIDNHFVDFRGDRAQVTNVPGQLQAPVTLDASVWRAAWTFIVQGVLHIVEGPDHVLFVLCMAIGAVTIHRLLWQVTGFTLGHSVTLIAGFFGLTPDAAWFIPAVEAAIALSIVYAGVLAIWKAMSPATVLVTTLIGLLHGFGFSFVLGGILGRNSPHLLVSLLSFNVGVEIGQVAIIAVTLAVLAAVRWFGERLAGAVRLALAGGSIAVALVWVVQRTDLILAAIRSSA